MKTHSYYHTALSITSFPFDDIQVLAQIWVRKTLHAWPQVIAQDTSCKLAQLLGSNYAETFISFRYMHSFRGLPVPSETGSDRKYKMSLVERHAVRHRHCPLHRKRWRPTLRGASRGVDASLDKSQMSPSLSVRVSLVPDVKFMC